MIDKAQRLADIIYWQKDYIEELKGELEALKRDSPNEEEMLEEFERRVDENQIILDALFMYQKGENDE